MVVDAGAVLAILITEPRATAIEAAIEADSVRLMSAATALEADVVVEAHCGKLGGRELDLPLHKAKVDLVSYDLAQFELARVAYRQYSKGRHPAGLNFGDGFAYALSRRSGEPLLFSGEDFSRTDIARALSWQHTRLAPIGSERTMGKMNSRSFERKRTVLETRKYAAITVRVLACVAVAAVVVLATVIGSQGTASAAQQDPLLLDVAGKWYLTFDSAMGPMNWVAVFEQEGDTFSGTCDIGMGQYPVTEGRVDENKISFIVELDMPGHEMLLSFEGTVDGDEAKGILTGMGDDQEWTGTRQE